MNPPRSTVRRRRVPSLFDIGSRSSRRRRFVAAAAFALSVSTSLPASRAQDAPAAAPASEGKAEKEPDVAARVEAGLSRWRQAGDALARARAERDLAAIGPAALAAVRAARDGARDEARDAADGDGETTAGLERLVTLLAAQEIGAIIAERMETGLFYDGQYDDLAPRGAEAVAACLFIAQDEEALPGLRRGALNALADLADASLLPRLRRLEGDPFLYVALREEIGVLMAVLGDTSKVDAQIRDVSRLLDARDPDTVVSANGELAHLYYKIRKYQSATECYERILAVFDRVVGLPNFRPNASFLKAKALHHYNAACSYSLAGDLETARKNLRAAIELDAMHYANMEKDGDLRAVREAPSFAEFKAAMKKLLEDRSL